MRIYRDPQATVRPCRKLQINQFPSETRLLSWTNALDNASILGGAPKPGMHIAFLCGMFTKRVRAVMRSAQHKHLSTHQYEVLLPDVNAAAKHHLIVRNHWQDYIAQNEPAVEALEAVVLARASDALAILAEDDGPIDEVYSIVVLSSDFVIDSCADVDWIQT